MSEKLYNKDQIETIVLQTIMARPYKDFGGSRIYSVNAEGEEAVDFGGNNPQDHFAAGAEDVSGRKRGDPGRLGGGYCDPGLRPSGRPGGLFSFQRAGRRDRLCAGKRTDSLSGRTADREDAGAASAEGIQGG